ncbi:DinB family protein [bacterium]|nr:DinB family protein [bacterium]
MEITDSARFLEFYERVHERTLRVMRCIPPDELDWTYREGKFTLGDLIRHLGAINRYMFAENAQLKPSRYPGHGKDLADGYVNVLAFYEKMHQECVAIIKALTPEDLQKKCVTPGGVSITVWKWLRSMVEHEIHHRGQIFIYLGMLNVPTTPLYGHTSEEVYERSQHG